MSQTTITINGRVYDARTGLPLEDVSQAQAATLPAAPKTPHARSVLPHSHAVHTSLQKSHTLNRKIVKNDVSPVAKKSTPSPVRRSPIITKFAPHEPAAKKSAAMHTSDIGPRQHHLVQKAGLQKPLQARTSHTPAQVLKNESIAEALAKAPSKKQMAHSQPRKRSKFARFSSTASVALALILLAGYFTYLNMPNLSTRIAAAQAGIDASYPEYKPDGYSLSGPVAYGQGQVSMKFASNAGSQSYKVEQAKSSWDSTAVLDNYVKKKAGESYITYTERGLTIYTFDGSAAWVNAGILYTISGDAPLSSDQIRRIATSM
jgi:hypothetical protein